MTVLNLPENFAQELLDTIESLRTKLLAERRRNLEQEMEIRKEMGDAMLQQIMESEELRRFGSVAATVGSFHKGGRCERVSFERLANRLKS